MFISQTLTAGEFLKNMEEGPKQKNKKKHTYSSN
jgi:hypothetical protein